MNDDASTGDDCCFGFQSSKEKSYCLSEMNMNFIILYACSLKEKTWKIKQIFLMKLYFFENIGNKIKWKELF